MKSLPFLPYAQPHIDDGDRQAVSNILTTSQLTRGQQVDSFEQAVADYCGARFAVAFNSGTSALHGAYFAAGINACDRLVTTPNTFVGTVAGALLLGAQLQLVDIEPQSGNLIVDQVISATQRPLSRGRHVITAVHFRGAPVPMHLLNARLTDPHAVVIEDAAQALGATDVAGKPIGSCSHSDMTLFSFHPAKSMTTGEGGMVLTNDEILAKRLSQFRNNGLRREDLSADAGPWSYEIDFVSGNFHLTDFQAALGISQLAKLDTFITKRRELVAYYRQWLDGMPHLTLLEANSDGQSAHHLFVVRIDFEALGKPRAAVMEELSKQGIGTQVHYIPLYHQPAIKQVISTVDCPQAERFYAQALSLPLYYDLAEKDVDRICNALIAILK